MNKYNHGTGKFYIIKNMRRLNFLSLASSLLALLVFFVPLIIWNGTLTAVEIKNFLVRMAVPVMILFLFANFFLQKTVPELKGPLLPLTLAFLSFNLFSYLLSPFSDSETFLCLALEVLLFLACIILLDSKRSVNRLLLIWQSSAVLVGLYYLLQNSGMDFLEWEEKKFIPIGSTFTNRNHLVYYLLCTFPFSIYLLLQPKNLLRISGCAGLMISLSCIAISQSRTAPFLCILFLASFLLFYRKQLKSNILRKIFLGGAFLIVLSLLAAGIYGALYISRLSHEGLDKLSHERLMNWQSSLNMIKAHPILGSGTGTFPALFPQYRLPELGIVFDPSKPLIHAHNEYLELTAETGIIGLLLYLVLIFSVILPALHALRGNPPDRPLLFFSLWAALNPLFFSFFSVEPRYLYCGIFFWISLALCNNSRGERPRMIALTGSWRKIFLGVSIILSAGVIISIDYSIRWFRSEIYLKTGLVLSSMINRTGLALAQIDRAIEINPGNVPAYYQRGFLLLSIHEQERALKDYLKVQTMNPNFQNIHYNLGMIYYRKKQYPEAIQELLKTAKIFPRFEPAFLALAECFYYTWDFKKSLEWCGLLLQINPNHEKALFLKNYILNR